MKTLLIRLNYRGFPIPQADMPLGLLYVAAALENAGHEVVVRDLNRQEIEAELWDEIEVGSPDGIQMVGITMLSYVRAEGYQLINKIKALNPKCFVIVGGIFTLAFPAQLLGHYPIDAVVIGEGESAAIELANHVKFGGNIVSIKGVYTKEHGWHGDREIIDDLDRINFPAWNHTNLDWFKMTCATITPDKIVNGVRLGDARWAPVIASRGCKGRCIFCNAFDHWGRQVRLRSAQNVLDEVEVLYREHGVRLLAFNDDAFPSDKQQCLEFCAGLKDRGLQIAWQTTARADAIDAEVCSAMESAGCFMVAVGVESGSQTIHRGLGKGINLESAKRALQTIRESGMTSYALLMIGNPGETNDTITETIEFLKDAKPNYFSFVAGVMVVPGTELYRRAERAGMIDAADWFDENKNGLPIYTVENTQEQLNNYAARISAEVPRAL